MNFRRAAKLIALGSDTDLHLDPTMQDVAMPGRGTEVQPPPATDGLDPAMPGGSAPYNGAEPFGEPVVSDPEWLDPQDQQAGHEQTMPHITGPGPNALTLHGLRRQAYLSKEKTR